MNGPSKRILSLFTIAMLVVSTSTCVVAEESSSSIPPSEQYRSSIWKPILNIPTTITKLIKIPLEAGVVYVDKHMIYEKVDYVISTLNEKGIYPFMFDVNEKSFTRDGVTFRNGVYSSSRTPGILGVKYEKARVVEDVFTGDLGASGWFRTCAINGNVDAGARLSLIELTDLNIYSAITARYQNSPEELFYGVGRHHSVANKYDFEAEEISLDYIIGKEQIIPTVSAELGVGYSHIDISEGDIKGPQNLNDYPTITGSTVNGIGGADLITYGASLIHDTRDNNKQPTDGGYEKVTFTFNNGVDDDDNYNYWKLRGDAVRYLPLHKFIKGFTPDKILVLRGAVERNCAIDGKQIPFFDLARLDRQEVRGYDPNRFLDKNLMSFSVAYRYTVWRWKEMKVNASLFYDFGWSFDEFSKIRGSEVKDGFGLALRFIAPGANVLSLEAAHSSEGSEFLVRWTPRF